MSKRVGDGYEMCRVGKGGGRGECGRLQNFLFLFLMSAILFISICVQTSYCGGNAGS